MFNCVPAALMIALLNYYVQHPLTPLEVSLGISCYRCSISPVLWMPAVSCAIRLSKLLCLWFTPPLRFNFQPHTHLYCRPWGGAWRNVSCILWSAILVILVPCKQSSRVVVSWLWWHASLQANLRSSAAWLSWQEPPRCTSYQLAAQQFNGAPCTA